jgi:hypothetical protein
MAAEQTRGEILQAARDNAVAVARMLEIMSTPVVRFDTHNQELLFPPLIVGLAKLARQFATLTPGDEKLSEAANALQEAATAAMRTLFKDWNWGDGDSDIPEIPAS